jgi:hypothetical protein
MAKGLEGSAPDKDPAHCCSVRASRATAGVTLTTRVPFSQTLRHYSEEFSQGHQRHKAWLQ